MEPLGAKLRQQRRLMKMTLDDLAARASISKPYLSLIETGRVPNPPSDEKLSRLEKSLGFAEGELISHAHLHRTPVAVRTMLTQLLRDAGGLTGTDNQHLAKLIEKLSDKADNNLLVSTSYAIPIINGVSTGYPRGFTDLSFPLTVATDFISCPDLDDKEAFAVRVADDRMTPRYHPGDIVILSPAKKVRSGDDCFVCFDDGNTTFKRIFLEKGDDGEPIVRVQPRNEKHRARMVPTAKIAAMYRAVYRLHALADSAD